MIGKISIAGGRLWTISGSLLHLLLSVNNIIFLGMREAQLFAVAGIVLASIAGYWLILRAKKRGRLFH